MPKRFGIVDGGGVRRTRKAWVGGALAAVAGGVAVAQDAQASGVTITLAAIIAGAVNAFAVYWTANDDPSPEE